MKRVYLYLQDGRYSCYADISDEVELPPYSTLTMPPETMTNPYWINGQWINKEQTPDKVPNYQEVLDPLPTTQQKIMMQQSQQITVLQTLSKSNSCNKCLCSLISNKQQQTRREKINHDDTTTNASNVLGRLGKS